MKETVERARALAATPSSAVAVAPFIYQSTRDGDLKVAGSTGRDAGSEAQGVARLEFLEWADSTHVRHIKFLAMRDDKDPRKVLREG
jgi:ATP-dependent DNA ligase